MYDILLSSDAYDTLMIPRSTKALQSLNHPRRAACSLYGIVSAPTKLPQGATVVGRQ
jgi:hypothetical protein